MKLKTKFKMTIMNEGFASNIVVDHFGIKIIDNTNTLLSYMTPPESELFAINILKAIKSKKMKSNPSSK